MEVGIRPRSSSDMIRFAGRGTRLMRRAGSLSPHRGLDPSRYRLAESGAWDRSVGATDFVSTTHTRDHTREGTHDRSEGTMSVREGTPWTWTGRLHTREGTLFGARGRARRGAQPGVHGHPPSAGSVVVTRRTGSQVVARPEGRASPDGLSCPGLQPGVLQELPGNPVGKRAHDLDGDGGGPSN
jgi:hypothetical protein